MRRIFVRNSLSYLLGRPLVESKVGHGYSRTPLLKLESRKTEDPTCCTADDSTAFESLLYAASSVHSDFDSRHEDED
ncbi:hypothetical protein RRG08_029550 [Elysia crispata]|uniref:Uncharacterized protein n=1 Tax=Elysia crispata TaxID=231223 RepID=A0AAE0XW33_9GAST|nr:hypothetical protein RRG08_029550 [Elysia crispata]